jgi:hypothetical protein
LFRVELIGDDDGRDASRPTNLLDRVLGRLAETVMLLADSRTVVEVVPTVGPEPTFDEVVRVELAFWRLLSGLAAEHALVAVARKDSFAEVVARK